MALSAHFVKLRSLGLWSAVLTTTALSVTGCLFVRDDSSDHAWDDDGYTQPVPTEEPALVAIDTDAVLNAEPGEGVGVFVEYATGGNWRVWTTCDTNSSQLVCAYDIYASVDPSSEIRDVAGEDIEGADLTLLDKDGFVYFRADTDTDTDGMTFTTTPGAIVRFEIYLDGRSQPRFVYWFGGGVLHTGAPTNPMDFEPTFE